MQRIFDPGIATRASCAAPNARLRLQRAAALLLCLSALLPRNAMAQAYAPDRTFNGGQYYVDAFFDTQGRSHAGQELVRLDNGDVIVAGVVPPIGVGNNAVNLGLVRYNAAGQRVAWASPNGYAFNGNQHIVYPNSNDITAGALNILAVKDMQVFGSRLFVLVDGNETDPLAPAGRRARVIVFTLGGALQASAAVGAPDIVGGGIALYSGATSDSDMLVFGGSTDPSHSLGSPYYARYRVAADGNLSPVIEMAVPCPAGGCRINGVALKRSLTGVTGVYLAGGKYVVGPDWDYLVMALNLDGTPMTTFSDDGIATVGFNVAGRDIANAVVVSRSTFGGGGDELYLVGDAWQRCKNGVGVAKLTATGALDTDFGTPVGPDERSGRTVIGGSHDSVCLLNSNTATGVDAALSGDALGVAGHLQAPPFGICGGDNPPCAEDRVDAIAIVLDAVTGDLRALQPFPFAEEPGGPRTRQSSFSGIVGSGDGVFTLAGTARFRESAPGAPPGAEQFATLRVVPSGVLFADGFESD